MTDDFEDIRNRLYQDLTHLTDLWEQYRFLFAADSDRVDVLNKHASWFFATVQRTYLEAVLLRIARLTDPPVQGGNRNLVLETLLADPVVSRDACLTTSLQTKIDRAKELARPIRTHRNKAVAHQDHAVRIGEDLLPTVTLSTVEQCLAALRDIHFEYGSEVLDRDTSYDVRPFGSVKELVDTLAAAPSRTERRMAEVRRMLGEEE